MKTAIWWIRKDIRFENNHALQACLKNADNVVPLFILDPILLSSPRFSQERLDFLLGGLNELSKKIESKGNKLIFLKGNPISVLKRIITQLESSTEVAIYAEADYTPYARNRDKLIQEELNLYLVGSPAFYMPDTILKPNGKPYTIFTPFSKAWKSLPSLGSHIEITNIDHIPALTNIQSENFPYEFRLPQNKNISTGENAAKKKLSEFTEGHNPNIYSYIDLRNDLSLTGTSQLSPYLHFGMLSIIEVINFANNKINRAQNEYEKKSATIWLNELIWRDFYIHIIYHYPHVTKKNFRNIEVKWENNQDHFKNWCAGTTGYPIIDAAMRELAQSNWMHNRARMIVSSFLTKNLLIDWRMGEKWFLQNLIDGDIASNNGGWQWAASTGTDAVPYFRIFNPYLQSKKYDTHGIYIKKWVPELTNVPIEYIHYPHIIPEGLQKKYNCRIDIDYPRPIIDYNKSRERAIERFKNAYNKPRKEI